MMKKIFGSLAVLAVTLTAGAALAATYVTGPLPGEFGGGQIPADPKVFKNEQAVQTEATKLVSALSKCYSKGAKNYSAGKATNVSACIGTGNPAGKGAWDKYNAKIAKIAAKAPGIPGCLDAVVLGATLNGLVPSFNPIIYCASPSGAFVDGAAGF